MEVTDQKPAKMYSYSDTKTEELYKIIKEYWKQLKTISRDNTLNRSKTAKEKFLIWWGNLHNTFKVHPERTEWHLMGLAPMG